VVSDVPVDDEAPVVTSRIFKNLSVLSPSEVLRVGFAYVYVYS
jgi:hypothetical protein